MRPTRPTLVVTGGETVDGHEGILSRPAFSPDGRAFAIGDGAGRLVVRSTDGEVLRSCPPPPPDEYGRPLIGYVRWSPDGAQIATMENYVLRVRRADDLTVVAERRSQFGLIAFTEENELLLATRSLVVFEASTLKERATFPIERRPLEQFDVAALFVIPGSSWAVVADRGGRSSDQDDRTTDRDGPQITVFDTRTGEVVKVFEDGVLVDEAVFDRLRNRVVTVSSRSGVSFFDRDFELVRSWRPYASRAAPPRIDEPRTRTLCACETYLATMPNMRVRTPRTIDLWDPTTLEQLATIPLPEGERPDWIALSPDGRTLITPTKEAGDRGPHPFRLWNVTA